MDEMQAPTTPPSPADAAMTYLDQYHLEDMPEDGVNLLHLLYSMIMVSFPVECWGQPQVPDSRARLPRSDAWSAPGPEGGSLKIRVWVQEAHGSSRRSRAAL